jgi:hypothetical protein
LDLLQSSLTHDLQVDHPSLSQNVFDVTFIQSHGNFLKYLSCFSSSHQLLSTFSSRVHICFEGYNAVVEQLQALLALHGIEVPSLLRAQIHATLEQAQQLLQSSGMSSNSW